MAAARRHLEALAAAPRPAGSAAEGAARDYCAARLRALGFSVCLDPFEFSAAPGRLATPVCGVALLVVFAAAGHLGWHARPWSAFALLAAGGALVGGSALWLMRRGVLDLPWLRVRATNLVATRGGAPAVWLVAHLDSKSQPVPILARALGVIGVIVLWIAGLSLAALQGGGGVDVRLAWPVVTVVGVLSAGLVAATTVGSRSPGARDNASGVATVLTVAEQIAREEMPLGVLLTSGEELGLAGARAWVRGRALAAASIATGATAASRGMGVAINFDGVDDDGALRLTYSTRRPPSVVAALAAAARAEGSVVRAGRLPPGALVDGVAFAHAGWSAVTVSKGTWRTVARIHAPADDLTGLMGTGVEEAARVAVRALRDGYGSTPRRTAGSDR